MPKVSVIVPVYNVEQYLHRCLDSLVNQTLQDIEIVIVNDGSKDSSPEIVKEYMEKYPGKIVYDTQENSGQAVARNRAFSMCSGDYIGFLDSDDFVKLEMFERMYSKAIETGADYVACGYTDMMYDKDGKDEELVHYVASKVALKQKDMFFGALASPFLHLYKREIIMEHGVRFPEGVIYEDTAFYLNLIPYIHKLEVIEEPLAYRTRHANSTMSTFKAERVAQIFPVLDCILNYYKDNGFYDEFRDELEYFCVRVLLCSSMERIGKVGARSDRKQLVSKTMDYIETNFPAFKSNRYFEGGMQNKYIKSYSRKSAMLLSDMIRIKGMFGKKYS